MSKLSPLPGDKVVEALKRAGFRVIRQRGSHIFLRHPDGRATVVPVHKGEELGRGILRRIIHDTELTRKDFLQLFK